VVEVRLHSAGAASRLHPNAAAALGTPAQAAWLLVQIFPIFSLVPAAPITGLGVAPDCRHGLSGLNATGPNVAALRAGDQPFGFSLADGERQIA
jgi:hypothetical protein